MRRIKIYCDGGSRGNPGNAAGAFAVFENEKLIKEKSKYLGITTNNVAEYNAVLMGLKWLEEEKDFSEATFVLDSLLVTKQLTGEYKIKSKDLIPLALKAKEIERKINIKVSYSWSPRDDNKVADSLVNKELDNKR